jgi:phosphoglycolate phosphatase
VLSAQRFPLRVKAIGFDLDGTLIDTAGDLALAANAMRQALDLPPIAAELIKSFIGHGIPNLVHRTLSVDRDPSEDELRRGLALYEHYYAEFLYRTSTPYPGVFAGLAAMRGQGYPLVCITNKSARFTDALLEQTGLAEFFVVTLSGDSLPRKKPDPLPFLHVCEQLGIGTQEFLYIGDSANDTQAARAAGSPVFVVAYGYHQRADPAELGADAVVAGLVEAAKLIENSAV